MLIPEISKRLAPMIGVRADVGGNELTTAFDTLKNSTTGLTLDQCHELLQLSTLRLAAPETADQDQFADWVRQTRDDAVTSLLNTLDTRLTEASLTPQLLASRTFFAPMIGRPSFVVPQNRSVGIEITPSQNDVTLQLERLQFWGTFPDGFKIDLIDADNYERQAIVPVSNKGWVDVNIPLLAGRRYWLIYKEADLLPDGIAFNSAGEWPRPKRNCKGCALGCVSTYADVTSISVDAEGSISRDQLTNYGLNVTLSAAGDVSSRLLDNPRRLLSALREQVAVTFLSKIAFSKRLNGNTVEAKKGAVYALNDANNPARKTLALDKAIAAVVKALSAEASAALDINDSDDVTWGVI